MNNMHQQLKTTCFHTKYGSMFFLLSVVFIILQDHLILKQSGILSYAGKKEHITLNTETIKLAYMKGTWMESLVRG